MTPRYNTSVCLVEARIIPMACCLQVEEVNMFREKTTHSSTGCGYVTMVSHEQAATAQQTLDASSQLTKGEGVLSVNWAGANQTVNSSALDISSAAKRTVSIFTNVSAIDTST